MWYEINHIMFMIDLTWCDMYTTNCQVCDTKSSRNSRRCRMQERTSTYTAVLDFPVYFLKTKKLYRMIYTKKMILNEWTARYVIRNQPHDVSHAETERPRVKKSRRRYLSWMKVVGMIDHVWYALKMMPGTAKYVIRNQPHDVHDRSHMMW